MNINIIIELSLIFLSCHRDYHDNNNKDRTLYKTMNAMVIHSF